MSCSLKSCMLCDYDYDEKEKKPLMLPCGHSFCKECFDHLSTVMNHLCPVCRKDWSECQVDSLPICYQLLPEQGANDPYLCLKHKTHMTIWCCSCRLRICLDCCWQDHRKCSWKPVKKAVADLLNDIGPNTDKVRERLSLWETHAEKLSRFSRQLIRAITENLSDLRLLEEVSKRMEFYSRNVDHICEQIRQSQSNLQSLGLEYSEGDALDLLTALEEKMTVLNHLGEEPEWPKVPKNSFLRIMDSFHVIKEAFDQLSTTSNEHPKYDGETDACAEEEIAAPLGLMSGSDVVVETVSSVRTNVREETKTSAGTDPAGEDESSEEITSEGERETLLGADARREAELSEEFDSTEEEEESSVRNGADKETGTTPYQAHGTNFSIRSNVSPTAEVSGTSNVPAESDVDTGVLETSDSYVPSDPSSSSLMLSQTSSTLISALASSLRSSAYVDSHDPDLYFFKGILPDVKKLSNSNKMLFKQRVLVRLNALLSGDPSN